MTMRAAKLQPSDFVKILHELPPQPNVFNPWRDFDEENDISEQAPHVRSEHLERYLSLRCASAKLLLIAEAPGWYGAKFSGIAMTSERMLLDQHNDVRAEHVLEIAGQRTSNSRHQRSRTERTATIVWKSLLHEGLSSREFVLWNAMPCHPHSEGARLSNRSPIPVEMEQTTHVLRAMLSMFDCPKVIAIGNQARDAFERLKVEVVACVPHPAGRNDAVNRFRTKIHEAIGNLHGLKRLVKGASSAANR